MKLKILAGMFALFLLIACTSEEKLVDNSVEKWNIIYATNSTPSALGLINQAGTLFKSDVYSESNGKSMLTSPNKIVEYRDYYYIFYTALYKIEVIDKITYKTKTVIDFSADMLEPTAICFPNATDAYICHGNDTSVTLFDIYNLKIARRIKVGKNPVDIKCAGNQIYTANIGDNTVSVIDSRYHTEDAVINVWTAPAYLDVSYDTKKVVIISLGSGKVDKSAKTPAKATVIDVASRAKLSEVEIASTKVASTDQFPIGVSISKTNNVVVMTQTTLIRFSLTTPESIRTIEEKAYKSIQYNSRRDEFVYLQAVGNSYQVVTGYATTGAKKALVALPTEPSAILPIN